MFLRNSNFIHKEYLMEKVVRISIQ